MLLVVPVMPARGCNGLAMRAGLLAEGLAGLGPFRIVVVAVFGDPGPASELVSELGASVDSIGRADADPAADFRARLTSPALRERAAALHPKPALCRAANAEVAERIAELAERARGVVVMRSYLAPVLDLILGMPGHPPVILDLDDIESSTLRSLGEIEQAERFAVLERHYLPLVDRALTCSEADASEIRARIPGVAVEVVPNAVRPPAQVPRSLEEEAYDLLFVGNLSYGPNVGAARWLCEEVLPRLASATVALVGSHPTPAVLDLASDRVTVAADVADVGEWYARSRIAVAPLRAGGGTKIKVIEALAHARPVVATPAGARGLEAFVSDDGAVVVAESAEEFVHRCADLLADPLQAARRGLEGRERVVRIASVEVVADRLRSLAAGIFSP